MKSIWQDIRDLLNKPEQGLVKIMVINAGIFFALMLSKVVLIIANQAPAFELFIEQISLSSNVLQAATKPWTFFTYFFVHLDLFHLIFNMLFLYGFGQILQDLMGQTRLYQVYFLGCLAGAFAFLVVMNTIPYFIAKGPTFLMGASAGVYAIVVAAATLRPNYKVHLFLIGPVAIKYISAFYIVWSVIEMIGSNAGGNIAHLGGAILGFSYAWIDQQPQNTFKVPKREKVLVGQLNAQARPMSEREVIDEEELNRILDKISKSGYDSLSKIEKRRLFMASQKNE